MEPTSIIDGLTGISVAGTALSRALFDLVGGLDDSPVDIVEIAQGLSDTSIAIRELRRVLRRNKQLCRNRLTRAVDSLMSQVEIVQDELFDIVRSSGPSLSRVISAFRRTKTTKLLEQVKTHKTTAQLMATTVALADREREHGETRSERWIYAELERERAELRKEAETLLRELAQSIKSLSHGKHSGGVGIHTNASESLRVPNHGDEFARRSRSPSVGSRSRSPSARQLQQAAFASQNGPLWLFELVFGNKTGLSHPSAEMPSSGDEILMAVATAYVGDQALTTGPVSPLVNGLLLRWTVLQPTEIFGPVILAENRELERWESTLRERVQLLKASATDDMAVPALPPAMPTPRDPPVEPRRDSEIPRVQEPSFEPDGPGKPRTEAHTKIIEIDERFRRLVPPCVKFIAGPPTDPEKRDDEHRRHSELILRDVIIKLDNLDVAGDDSVRTLRRNLVKEAQEMLDKLDAAKLDATFKSAANHEKGKARRESAGASSRSASASYQEIFSHEDPDVAYGSDSDWEVHPRRYRFAPNRGVMPSERPYEEPQSPHYEPGRESRRTYRDMYGTSPRDGPGSTLPPERRTAFW